MTRIFAPEVVSDVGAGHGECPTWNPADRSLVWVDISAGQIHRFDPSTGADEAVSVGSQLGSVAPRSSGGLVLAIEEGFAVLDSFAGEPRLVAAIDHGPGPVTRMNDGKCDSQGRFWAGSMAYDCAPGHAALYRLDPDLRVSKVLGGITISNGLDWSDDGRTLFTSIRLLASRSGTSSTGLFDRASTPLTSTLSPRHCPADTACSTFQPSKVCPRAWPSPTA